MAYPAMRRLLPGAAKAGRRGFAHRARSIAAQFVRGGTSNGLVIEEAALPAYARGGTPSERLAAQAAAWAPVLAPAMGAPDPYGRQLDGMGSGVSSTSKVCVIAERADDDDDDDKHDVAFTFVQVGIRDGQLDLAGNCGNMISAVGPLAFDRGWGARRVVEGGDGDGDEATVRIFNTNTRKTIVSRFRVAGSPPRFCPDGDYGIDGVAGARASRITLSFLRPAGARTGVASGLPTGRAVEELEGGESRGRRRIQASLVDVSNPGVFVLGEALGLKSDDNNDLRSVAAAIEADASLRATLEHLRQQGATRMGLDPLAQSVPKIVLLFPAGETDDADVDIRCVALSMGQVHKAVPLTLALCLGAAARMPGTLAEQLVRRKRGAGSSSSSTLSIGHPGGRVDVGTTLDADGTLASAELHRTARVLMEGRVFY